MRVALSLLTCIAAIAMSTSVLGNQVEFIPPNDPTGSVFTTNSNDGYSTGRGVVFAMTGNALIDSIGIFHDLTSISLNYSIAEVTTVNGQVDAGQNVLSAGTVFASTNGLEWIDVLIGPTLLENGKNYHIAFAHSGSGNQNFFYDNDNVRFSQGAFSLIDGTHSGGTGNTVMPAIRVNIVPEPASAIVLVTAMGLAVCIRRRES